ncbi:MAG TPA: DUF411 domain-containing protein [Allosphingosinicella sp.]|jgi:hypothetical protein
MRRLLRSAFLGPALLLACTPAAAATIEVIKTASCGCCAKWVEHLRKEGFTVKIRDVQDVSPTARALGVPDQLRSCHSAKTGGYAVEGHVPAGDIKRLLREKPKAAGIAVPGMPAGSPGMEGGRKQPYATMIFQRDGKHRIFAQH